MTNYKVSLVPLVSHGVPALVSVVSRDVTSVVSHGVPDVCSVSGWCFWCLQCPLGV